MARHPNSTWRPIPETFDQPAITPTQIIFHTAVDGANTTTLFGWWNQPGNTLEAHFYAQKDGTGEQYLDTEVRADANYLANGRAVSIEAWDGQATYGSYQPYTDGQIRYLIELGDWLCHTHNIPRQLCPAWDAPGIGWHNMYKQWSPGATGCPGPHRIAQIREVILPAIQAAADLSHNNPGEDDMASVMLTDPRDGRVWHVNGNTKVHLTTMEQVNTLKYLGVKQIDNAPVNWIDATATLPR